MSDNLPPLPISLEKFTELAHRTASRYSHRSELEKIAYTFLPYTLEDFHRQVCAAIEANTPAVPDGWKLVPVEPTQEMVTAGKDEYGEEVFSPHQVTIVYRDMLLSAPQPQPVAQPVQASEWKPIETAPKNCRILIGRVGHQWAVSAKWNERKEYWSTGQTPMDFFSEPTHWMPLPPPPVNQNKE